MQIFERYAVASFIFSENHLGKFAVNALYMPSKSGHTGSLTERNVQDRGGGNSSAPAFSAFD
jgi:hypothetical protein